MLISHLNLGGVKFIYKLTIICKQKCLFLYYEN